MQRVMLAWREGGGPVVAPRYRGIRGNPVLFDSALFGALGALVGEHGARDLIASGPDAGDDGGRGRAAARWISTRPGDYDELLKRSRKQG
jgi:CTP:molybdopterin cytidylyltransferase MocA